MSARRSWESLQQLWNSCLLSCDECCTSGIEYSLGVAEIGPTVLGWELVGLGGSGCPDLDVREAVCWVRKGCDARLGEDNSAMCPQR